MESQEAGNGHGSAKAHFVFVPLMAQGHVIPAVDTALLLATHGALASIVGTPSTMARIRPTIDRAQRSGLPVRLIELPLNYAEAGLPDGADNMDTVPGNLMLNYFDAVARLREPLECHLRAHAPYPTCIVSDFSHPWTMELAGNLKVPRLTFFSMCAFGLLVQFNVDKRNAFDGVADDNEVVVVPGMAPRFEVTRAQAPPGFFRYPGWEKFDAYVERAQVEADGIVMNTFHELEPEFIADYASARGKKVWTVGPVSLYHEHHTATMAARGDTAAIDANDCLRWLDSKEPNSVLYISFGSLALAEPTQVIELGLGLEASEQPFIWVIKNVESYDETIHKFLRELEDRLGGRALLIRGWAPQVLILSHASIGGFVTHCGWNSTLEAVTAGVPVVTWPHFSDQFFNEKMAVEVLGIGVSIGVKEPLFYTAEKKNIVMQREVVEAAVRRVMDGEEEGAERRRRARALAVKARVAVHDGGSSHANLLHLIKNFEVEGEGMQEKV